MHFSEGSTAKYGCHQSDEGKRAGVCVCETKTLSSPEPSVSQGISTMPVPVPESNCAIQPGMWGAGRKAGRVIGFVVSSCTEVVISLLEFSCSLLSPLWGRMLINAELSLGFCRGEGVLVNEQDESGKAA